MHKDLGAVLLGYEKLTWSVASQAEQHTCTTTLLEQLLHNDLTCC
jgi:hypothetical protein